MGKDEIIKPLSCSACPFMKYRKPHYEGQSRFRCNVKQTTLETSLFEFETEIHKKCPAHKRGGTLYVKSRRKENNKEAQAE